MDGGWALIGMFVVVFIAIILFTTLFLGEHYSYQKRTGIAIFLFVVVWVLMLIIMIG